MAGVATGMAQDRFIEFGSEKPSEADAERILKNFLGGCGAVRRDGDRWLVDLPGKCTSPFKDIPGAYALCPAHDERWIEVIYSAKGKTMDVLTRTQDDFTNALADTLARIFSRFYSGIIDDD